MAKGRADDGLSAALEDSSAATRRCPYCGRQNEQAALYCLECGTELRLQITQVPRRSYPSAAPGPLHWLLRRRRGLRPMLWLAATIGFFHFGLFGFGSRFLGMGGWLFGISWAFGFAALVLTGAVFAWVASRFFVEARHTGELELLLTTPVGARTIISTQWSALRSLVLGPLLLMLVPSVLRGIILFAGNYHPSGFWRHYESSVLVLNAVSIVLRVGALCAVGMWFGLRAGTQGRAIVWTLLLVEGVPYALGMAWWLVYVVLAQFGMPSPWMLGSLATQFLALFYLLWLIVLANRQLRHEITGAEPLPLRQVFAGVWPDITALVNKVRHWTPVQPSG